MYSDGSMQDITADMQFWRSSSREIAPISRTGVVTGLKPGNFRVSAKYAGREAAWDLRVSQSAFRPPGANEVTGWVRGANAEFSIELWPGEVEVVGGPSDGRRVATIIGGFFRVEGLQAAGFELLVRRRGYESGRVHVPELGRQLNINLAVAPDIMNDVLEGDVCFPTRTIAKSFKPAAPGFLRITGSYFQSTTYALYADGVAVNTSVLRNEDIELQAGVVYELRATGYCGGETLSTRAKVTMLRPFD